MKTTVLAVLGVALPGLALAQSATFEVNGFPVSLHQAQVMALPGLHETAVAPIALERGGFPASPVQMLVLTPGGKERRDAAAQEDTERQLLMSASDH